MTDEKKNKGGRPRAETPGVKVTTWLRAPDYDRLYTLAKRDDKSLSGAMRDLLRLRLK
jgi:hypothetical protein